MDWLTSLAIGFGLEARKQEKAAGQRQAALEEHRHGINEEFRALDDLLSSLSLSQGSAMPTSLEDARELIPFYPLAEILSLQGTVGAEQEAFLRDAIAIMQPRFNLHQFISASVERSGSFCEEWARLTALNDVKCGRIWHALIEAVCRQRTPEVFQSAIDALGAILYHFWLLENDDMTLSQICYRRIIETLNIYGERDQKTPWLHAVMLLQAQLAEAYGGAPQDYLVLADAPDAPDVIPEDTMIDMDGRPGYRLVALARDHSHAGCYAVRACNVYQNELDLIWEMHGEPRIHTIFFEEQG